MLKRISTLIWIALLFSNLDGDVSVPLDHPDIQYVGAWFTEVCSSKVVFNRHTDNVLTQPESGISATS